jgi:hypothetical protein
MSLNKRLPDHTRFAYDIFAAALMRVTPNNTPSDLGVEGGSLRSSGLIIAGGAVRDLYFGKDVRDVDLYFNGSVVNLTDLATELHCLDVDRMARERGFESAALIRRNAPVTKSTAPDDVQSASIPIGGMWAVPTGQGFYQISASAPKASTGSGGNSGSGSKQDAHGKQHPLRSVEEFTLRINDQHFDIELMDVAMNPIDYVMTHFAVKLCRCYYDGTAVRYTPDFFSDAQNKTLTVACAIEHARLERLFSYYLPKLQYYFPDFTVRVDLNAMNRGTW